MSTYPIESHIPAPKRRGSKSFYPIECMQVGDSFFVPHTEDTSQLRNQILNAARAFKPRRFTSRKYSNGVRLWRIE